MKCNLCGQRIFHARGLKLRLCTSCLKGLEPVLYSRHMMTLKRDTFKLSVLYSYTDSTKNIIYNFKFSKQLKMLKTISCLMLELLDLKNCPDLIVPVPSHPMDEIKRGYSHMSITANYLSKLTGIKSLDAVKRKFFPVIKRNQKFKSREQRLKGPKKFKLRVDVQKIEQKNILLIDDVTTTGSTVSECSQLLLDNGAKSVQAVCLALTRL